MSNQDKLSTPRPARQDADDPSASDQEDFLRPAGNRLFFWLLVATAFFILDMAILFYVFRPTTEDVTVQQIQPAPTVQQAQQATSTVPPERE